MIYMIQNIKFDISKNLDFTEIRKEVFWKCLILKAIIEYGMKNLTKYLLHVYDIVLHIISKI